MINRIKYMTFLIVLISCIIWGVSLYLEVKIHKKTYEDSIQTVESNILENYKTTLKNSVLLSIEYIDIYYDSLLEYYKELLGDKTTYLTLKLQNKSNIEIKEFLKDYIEKDFIKIKLLKPNKNYILQKTIKINNQDLYLYIEDKIIKNRLIKSLKQKLYKVNKNEKRYIWIDEILDFKGGEKFAKRLIHPNIKHSEGSYLSTNITDIKDKKIYEIELNGINANGETFFRYHFKELDSDKISEKISYVKLYDKFNWVIATGIPLNKLEEIISNKKKYFSNNFEKHFEKIVFLGVVTLLLFTMILLYLYFKISEYTEENLSLERRLYKNKLDIKYQRDIEKKEKEYRELFYNNNSVILIVDPNDKKIINSNKAAEDFYGYSHDEFKQLFVYDINNSKKEVIVNIVNKIIENKRDEFVTKHILKSGKTAHVKIFSTATKYDGKVVLYSIVQDISEEIKAKKTLNETVIELEKIKENLDFAQKVSHIGSWEYTKGSDLLYWSSELYNIFGLKEGSATPCIELIYEYIHPDDKEKVQMAFYKSIEEKKNYEVHHRLLLKNGKIKYVEEYGEHFYDDEGNYLKSVGTTFDVTKTALLESNWESFFKLSLNLILVIDFDSSIKKVNPACRDILGYEIDELKGLTIEDLVHPLDMESTKKEFNATKNGKKTLNYENRFKHKDGTYRTLAWSAIAASENKIVYALAQDITELKNKNYLLSQQSKMAAMGEMLGNIAHQWRQPLSLISTLATGTKIKKELDNLSTKEFFESMDAINNTTQFLSETIDDFRNFFNKNKSSTSFKVSDLINKTLSLISAQFTNHEIEIIKNIEDLELNALENEFLQVLVNILNNARDALLENRKDNRMIFIDIKKEEDMLIISIKDNAFGIPDDIISKVFEPYFTTKYKSQGTGIGLYMSEEIISKHMGGSLRVKNSTYTYEDEDYTGAEFIVFLPLK